MNMNYFTFRTCISLGGRLGFLVTMEGRGDCEEGIGDQEGGCKNCEEEVATFGLGVDK